MSVPVPGTNPRHELILAFLQYPRLSRWISALGGCEQQKVWVDGKSLVHLHGLTYPYGPLGLEPGFGAESLVTDDDLPSGTVACDQILPLLDFPL